MAAAAMLQMKLLIDTTSPQRVVFAEAGKEVVDFLLSLLALPLATVCALLRDRPVGTVSSLYDGVQALDYSYLLPGADIDDLLRPTVVGSAAATASISLPLPPPAPKIFFLCQVCGGHGGAGRFVTDERGAACPRCTGPMTDPLQYISPSLAAGSWGGSSSSSSPSPVQWALRRAVAGGPSASAKGYVKGAVTYMVQDDLTVTPMSTISSITLLNDFRVPDFSKLRERIVFLGNRECLEILRASLHSKKVLTDVFLDEGWP